MIIHTDRKNKVACRAFVGLVFSCLLIFGLFMGFSVKTALAETLPVDYQTNFPNYIENFEYFKASDYPITKNAIIKFKVKTTFDLIEEGICGYDAGTGRCSIFNLASGAGTYSAGQTYTITQSTNGDAGYNIIGLFGGYQGKFSGIDYWRYMTNSPYFWSGWTGLAENPYPSLTITYPLNNAEIAESFDIQGSYILPVGSGYNILMAGFFKSGDYDINWNNAVNVFSIPISEPSGSFDNLRISNYVPKDIYDIYFRVYGGGAGYEFPFHISNINIVSDLPYELPITREVPPDIPIFSSLSAQTIYTTYSNYASSTPFFNAITGAIEPIVLTIGDNLTFFSSQFSQENARDIGEKTGNGILLVRAYAGNINSFFNDLPIAEVLFLYLMTLVVVSVFRMIRILLKLIPFT